MESGTNTMPTMFEISVSSLSGASCWVDQRGSPHPTIHKTFQSSSKKSSGSILSGYRMPSAAKSDIAKRNIPTTVDGCDIPGGGLRISGHLVIANPTNVNTYMALNT